MNRAQIIILSICLGMTPNLPMARTMYFTLAKTTLAVSPMVLMDTIPVVIHVIHTGTPIGAPDNPPNSQLYALIAQMNDAFQLNGPLYGGANVGYVFQLATRSPTGTSTTGINRVDGSSIPLYSTGGITADQNAFPNSANEIPVKALSRWSNTDYLNIWIVNTIDGNPNFPGGYAYFPEYNAAAIDGIVLRASVVNGTNKTIIHELGHYFALYHTFGYAWGDCIPETDCTTDGDLICDTENCPYEFDCSPTTNPCTDDDWIIVDPAHGYTVLNNYMGYTDCQWMFTAQQSTRMHDALNSFRPGLLSSQALNPLAPGIPSVACLPTAVNGLSPYYGIERVEIGSLNVYSNTSQGDGAFYVDRTCNQQVNVAAGDIVPVQITCSYENWSQVKVFVDYNNNGVFTAPDELVLSGTGGVLSGNITIPLSSITLCTPLRLRVVVDHPDAPSPTPCLLTGTVADGVGQIEDYTIIIRPRHIESVVSGPWNVAGTWTCNCIPGASDDVTIRSGHTVTVTAAMGSIQCADVHLQPAAVLQMNGVMHVAGGCN